MEWNASVCSGDYAKLAKACGIQGNGEAALTDELISAIGSLCREMLIPESFVDFGLNKDHFEFIVKNCRSRSMECNPRPMSDDDVVALLKSMV
jgi:alcohol dehydrogenase class IV